MRCIADRLLATASYGNAREDLNGDAHLRRLAVIGELAASILHQVNGPLTYLLLNIDQAERAAGTAEAVAALHEARHGAEIIRDLSRDVTLLARGASQRAGTVDVRTVLASALRITSARIQSAASVIEEGTASPRVRGDATLLLQVLVNGLLNAADACEASSVRQHTIRVSLATDLRGNAVVAIADDGVGLPSERAARVFEPFFTTKEPSRGTGLGLSLAKRIVEDAGGQIRFDSVEGVGSVLRVTLPALDEDE
jgi:signal transduction histidine kinase